MIFGYARVSTKKQKLDRQIDNLVVNGVEELYQEQFTGTKLNRPEWLKLQKRVNSGDTIIFDAVSRMSRNAEEGVQTYFELLDRGVKLIFIKEPHINTEVYGENLSSASMISVNDADLDSTVIAGIRQYLVKLAEKQIQIAFEQSEKEAKDIVNRVKEGIQRSPNKSGSRLGEPSNNTKEVPNDLIRKHYTGFGGGLNKTELSKVLGVSRPTLNKWLNQV